MTISIPDEVLHDLVSRYGADPACVEFMGGGTPSSDGVRFTLPGSPPRILKVQVRPTADLAGRLAAAERAANVDVLVTQGVPMPSLQRSTRGRLLETVDLGQTNFSAYVTQLLPGHSLWKLPRHDRTSYLAGLARALARFHLASMGLPAWRASAKRLDDRPVISWELEWEFFASWCRDPDVLVVWRELRRELEHLPVDRDRFGFIHNDPHLGNVLVDGDRLLLVDLDVANYRWFASDLAMVVWSISGEGRHADDLAREQVHVFLDTYHAHSPSERGWLDELPVHLAYRRALLFIALYDELPPRTRDRWRASILAREVAGPWTAPPASRRVG